MEMSADDTMLNATSQFVGDGYSVTWPTTLSNHSLPANVSLHEHCVKLVLSQMEYIPWNNPDNLVSEQVENTFKKFKNLMLALLFLIGAPANFINMAVFYKQSLHDRVNLCLFSLSLADELFLISGISYHGEQLHLQFTTEENYGPVMSFLVNNYLGGFAGFSFVSVVLSTIIATERCLCVLWPLEFQTLLRTRTMAAIIAAVYVLVLGSFFVVGTRYHIGCVHDPESGAVFNAPVRGQFYRTHEDLVDFLHGFVFGVFLPGLVVVVVVMATVVTVVKLGRIVRWRAHAVSVMTAREVALTRMLIGNSIFFIACVSPVSLLRFVWFFFPEINTGRRHHNLFLITLWTAEIFNFTNASFNIFVYYAMGSRYRECFRALCSRKHSQGSSSCIRKSGSDSTGVMTG